ncbi:MAG: tRNA-binding protein [Gluconacetobacter diazotrophicus]|nr:tRNA-binding protein [Gluconacetobacter diazotrophicus]
MSTPPNPPPPPPVDYDHFAALDVRVGTVVDAQPFPEARKPAIRLWIDLGAPHGVKQSSAQVTRHYKPDQLIGRQVCVVANLPPRQVGPFSSEVLVLGLPDAAGEVVLVRPDHKVPNGGRLF